jgi:lysyl-tRNA synthetase class 2
MHELVQEQTGLDFNQFKTLEEAKTAAQKVGIQGVESVNPLGSCSMNALSRSVRKR